MHLSNDEFKMTRASRLLPLGALLLLTLSLLWYSKSAAGFSYIKGHASRYAMNPATNFRSPKDSTADVYNSTLGVRCPLNLLPHLY